MRLLSLLVIVFLLSACAPAMKEARKGSEDQKGPQVTPRKMEMAVNAKVEEAPTISEAEKEESLPEKPAEEVYTQNKGVQCREMSEEEKSDNLVYLRTFTDLINKKGIPDRNYNFWQKEKTQVVGYESQGCITFFVYEKNILIEQFVLPTQKAKEYVDQTTLQ